LGPRELINKKSFDIKELSPAVDVNLVINMYKSGFKQVDIRKKLGVAKSTISGIIKKYNI
jgi:predicted transcriptional regulator